MDVKVRITRAQLVALGACAAGLVFFDSLVPSGVFEAETATQVETAMNQVRMKNTEWANWLGPLGYGNGDGNGYGNGDGNGYGNGDGNGYGYGYGYGYGDGNGYGYGNGNGYGNGDGYGYGSSS